MCLIFLLGKRHKMIRGLIRSFLWILAWCQDLGLCFILGKGNVSLSCQRLLVGVLQTKAVILSPVEAVVYLVVWNRK